MLITSYKQPMPLLINVIRDPVDRMVSEYYYNLYGSSGKHWAERAPDNAMVRHLNHKKNISCNKRSLLKHLFNTVLYI